MKYISGDKFETKIWKISSIYILAFVIFSIITMLFGYDATVSKTPSWWDEAMNTMKLILFFIIFLFNLLVIIRGRRKMRSKEYQDNLAKDRINSAPEIKKLTKEEENKKYGL